MTSWRDVGDPNVHAQRAGGDRLTKVHHVST
jgi:hypothetical protein